MCRTRSVLTLGQLVGGCVGPRHLDIGRDRGGKVDGEGGSLAEPRVHRDGPAHPFDQVLRKREPDTGALDPTALRAQAVERLEHPIDVFDPDPLAGVRNGDPDEVVETPPRRPHAHAASGAVVLHRVRQQVQHDLEESLAIGEHVARVRTQLEVRHHRDLGSLRERVGEVDGVPEDLADRHGLQQELEIARLDPGDVENLVDQVQEVTAGPHDVADGLTVVIRQFVHLEELREPQHAVERRTQLVAHARQELALGLARLLGRFDGHVHLGLDLELVGDITRHHDRPHGGAVIPHHGLSPGVEHDPAAVGMTDAVRQVELGVGHREDLGGLQVDTGKVVGMDEGLDLVLDGMAEVVAEDALRRFADLTNLSVAVQHGDDVGASPDHGVEQALPFGQSRLDTRPFGDVGGDGGHPGHRTRCVEQREPRGHHDVGAVSQRHHVVAGVDLPLVDHPQVGVVDLGPGPDLGDGLPEDVVALEPGATQEHLVDQHVALHAVLDEDRRGGVIEDRLQPSLVGGHRGLGDVVVGDVSGRAVDEPRIGGDTCRPLQPAPAPVLAPVPGLDPGRLGVTVGLVEQGQGLSPDPQGG